MFHQSSRLRLIWGGGKKNDQNLVSAVDIFWQQSLSCDKNHNTMSQEVSIKIFYNLHTHGRHLFQAYCFIFGFPRHFWVGHFENIDEYLVKILHFLFHSINWSTRFTKFPNAKQLKIIQIYNKYKVHELQN